MSGTPPSNKEERNGGEGGVPDTAGLAVRRPMALHFFLLCLEGGVPDTAALALRHPMALHFFLLCLKAVFQTLLG